jgi:hypothetical protein
MKFDLKSLLKDKNVLYIVAFLAAMNTITYLISGNFEAVVFFGLTGYLTTYFSKNMIIILLVSMLTTNLLLGTRILKKHVEGMSGKRKKEVEEEEDTPSHSFSGTTPQGKPTSEQMTDKKKSNGKSGSQVDYAATLEHAYDNLDNLIGQDGIKKMSEQTERLASKQKELMQNIENMGPMLQKAGSMLKDLPLEGLGNLQSTVNNALKQLGGNKK